jgi:cytoskeleton protein RodZ
MSDTTAEAESPGGRLRQERERLGISLQQAADDMKLDSWAVEALESDDYDQVGPPVYAKGHLKKYAMLLAVPVAEIVGAYDALKRRPYAPVVPVRRVLPAPRLDALPWRGIAGGIAFACVAAVVVIWKPWQRAPSKPAATAALAPSPPQVPTAAPPPQAATPPPAAQRASTAATHAAPAASSSPAPHHPPPVGVAAAPHHPPAPAVVAVPAAAVAAARAPAAYAPTAAFGRARLRMSFSADSWVDVRDAAGRRLYSGRGRANTVKTVGGSAPLRVYLGFASGVSLQINEHAVAIGQQFVNGDIARFQAGADGVLRRDPLAGTSPGVPAQGQYSRNDPPRG